MARDIHVVVAHSDPALRAELAGWTAALPRWRVTPVAGEDLAAVMAAGVHAAIVEVGLLANLPAETPVPVVALAVAEDLVSYRAAMAFGARGLAVWPDQAESLREMVNRAAASFALSSVTQAASGFAVGTARGAAGGGPAVGGNLRIAVAGVKGGAGASLLCALTAAQLAAFGPYRTLLVDADLGGGDQAFLWNLPEGSGPWEVLAGMGDELDSEALGRLMVEVCPGLLLCSGRIDSSRRSEMGDVSSCLTRVLAAGAELAPVTVVDAGCLEPEEVAALEADRVVLVVPCDLPGVRGARLWLEALGTQGAQAAYVMVGCQTRSLVDASDAHRVLGVGPLRCLPGWGPEVELALADGKVPYARTELPFVAGALAVAHQMAPLGRAAGSSRAASSGRAARGLHAAGVGRGRR
ncbi:MAG: hypothetical protein WDA71_06525 [Actinomycetota bacterium]